MMGLLSKAIERTLENPAMFELQQKLCNDYTTVSDEFAEFLNQPRLKILDVGCSTGTCAGNIIDMKKHDYTGVDISPKYTAMASLRYPDGKFMAMDARRMSFEDNSFDIVMFNGVLHHMPDDLILDCAKEVNRVVKPEGVVLVGEPVFTDSKPISTFLLKLDRGKFIRDTESYIRVLKPLRVERQRYFPFSAHRFCSIVLKKV